MNEWIMLFLEILVVPIIAIFLENKFHIINRIRKRIAIMRNKGTDAILSLEYKSEKPFKEVVEDFKNVLRSGKNFKVDKITNSKAKFQYKTISITVIKNSQGNAFIEIDKIGCGIRDLKEKIVEFLGKVRELEKTKSLSEFVSCDLTFSLPYKWDKLSVWIPKGLKIKKYNIGFSEGSYKSEVEISLNKVNVKSDTLQSLTHVIEKFV